MRDGGLGVLLLLEPILLLPAAANDDDHHRNRGDGCDKRDDNKGDEGGDKRVEGGAVGARGGAGVAGARGAPIADAGLGVGGTEEARLAKRMVEGKHSAHLLFCDACEGLVSSAGASGIGRARVGVGVDRAWIGAARGPIREAELRAVGERRVLEQLRSSKIIQSALRGGGAAALLGIVEAGGTRGGGEGDGPCCRRGGHHHRGGGENAGAGGCDQRIGAGTEAATAARGEAPLLLISVSEHCECVDKRKLMTCGYKKKRKTTHHCVG